MSMLLVDPALRSERIDFASACEPFELGSASSRAGVVLFPLQDAAQITALQRLHPGAKLIGCAPFSASPDLESLTEIGLYQFLHTPLDAAELRQSLAFAASALEREEVGNGWPSACTVSWHESHKLSDTSRSNHRRVPSRRGRRASHA